MNQNLQDSSHENSAYERPNLNRTIVTLPSFDTNIDQANVQNPQKRSPVELTLPSLRARRGSFTLAMTALTIGFLLVAMNSPWSRDFMAPGPLSSPHAQLLAGRGAERCASCHGAAHESFSGWVSGNHGTVAQSALCMKCHENTLDTAFALQPHGVSGEQLTALTSVGESGNTAADFENSVTSRIINMVGASHGKEVACSVCHQEHHGNVSLTKLTDQQCQSCHGETFHSFETDHPEFNQWPQITRQNIAFDHGTHLHKHFKNTQAEFNCSLCHVGDDQQKVQRMASFEQACGGCHAQQIADSGQTGWKLLALPRLDMAAIDNLKLDVGNWPIAATGDFDGELPPMMRMLLAGDRELEDVVSQLDSNFSFGDIDITDSTSVELAVELVWGIKRLLHELALDGQEAIDRRMSQVMGDRYAPAFSKRLLLGLNPDVFEATEKRWLPNAAAELQTRQAQQMSIRAQPRPVFLTASYMRPAKPAARAQELLAKNPLSGIALELPPEPADNENELDASPRATRIPEASSEPSQWLAVNPLSQSTNRAVDRQEEARAIAPPDTKPQSFKHFAGPPKEIRLLPEIAGVALKSGWYRNDRLLEIGYRPIGHADEVVKSWNDCISGVENADTNPATSALFARVNSRAAAGGCRDCHTLNRGPNDVFEFAWLADRRKSKRASFTKFSHRPHLTQSTIGECASCHRLNESVSLVGTFEGCDAARGMSNFHPIVKADCVSCHQKGRTESGCMQCHNYHVGKPK